MEFNILNDESLYKKETGIDANNRIMTFVGYWLEHQFVDELQKKYKDNYKNHKKREITIKNMTLEYIRHFPDILNKLNEYFKDENYYDLSINLLSKDFPREEMRLYLLKLLNY